MQKRQQIQIISGVMAVAGVIFIGVFLFLYLGKYKMGRYKHSLYDFSVQYPLNWAVNDKEEGIAVMFISPQEGEMDVFRENVNIVVQDLAQVSQDPLDLDKYSRVAVNQMKIVFGDGMEILESESQFFAGLPGYRFVYLGHGGPFDVQYMHLWTIKDNKAYQFTYTASSTGFETKMGIVKRMAKSFRIL